MLSLRALGEILPGLSQWWKLLAALGIPGLGAASPRFLLQPHVAAPLCVSVCVSSLLIRTHVIELGPTIIQFDLILTKHICKTKTLFPTKFCGSR